MSNIALTPLEMTAQILAAFFKSFTLGTTEWLMKLEVQLECQLADCTFGCEMSPEQEGVFLENLAAVRPCLEWNKSLTGCSDVPIMRFLEVQLLRAFVENFHIVERSLVWRVKVSWKQWVEPDTWREELSSLLRKDYWLYRQVLLYDMASAEAKNRLLSTLANRLQGTVHRCRVSRGDK